MKWLFTSVLFLALLALLYKYRAKVVQFLGLNKDTNSSTDAGVKVAGIVQNSPLMADNKIIPTYSGIITTAPLDGISQSQPVNAGTTSNTVVYNYDPEMIPVLNVKEPVSGFQKETVYNNQSQLIVY
jgi:hypothetical protein